MNAGLHKLTAGDGYTYLTRQVAVMDSTQRGRSSMNDYYSMKGEAPGRWGGRGLTAFADITAGDFVSEAQMKSLFGLGHHPNADVMSERVLVDQISKGAKAKDAARAAQAAIRLGNPYRVYTDATAFRRRLAESYAEYNRQRTEKGTAPIPAPEREHIRTRVASEMFTDEVGRAPLPHELSGWIARNDRDKTSAVAGYDITFSPVKSFSALWAVADGDLRERMNLAHDRAIGDAVRWLEDNAAFTRTGTNGVAQVDIEGLITTAFTHRDARSGDPDLHTHLVVSNKVRSTDGRWLALDGRPLHRAKVTVSEVYNTALEAHAREVCGLEAQDREPAVEGKRAVREFVGVNRELCEFWSSRDREITRRFGELAVQFQSAHGREPAPVEAQRLRQQANLETRQAKHEPRTAAEQFQTWRREAAALLGDERAVADMIRTASRPTVSGGADPRDRHWTASAAQQIITTVSSRRATWQPHHVWAEARRIAREERIPAADVDTVCAELTTVALSAPLSVGRADIDVFADEPGLFRNRSGESVYVDSNTRQYTSWAVLDAEKRLVDAAHRGDGRTAYRPAVEVAILEHAANNPGRELNAGQMMLVREFALSGKRLQLALAPAGTGKTTAMKVLARAWESDGGHVLGLAPQGSAAGVLRADIGTDTATIDKLVHVVDRVRDAERRGTGTYFVPDWFAKIGPGSLVVIDEAGMAGTEILDRAVHHILGKGGSVRLIGDDRQQAAVAAGGVVRDIAESAGAVSLSAVMRFRDPAEGAATLALREGDPAAIGFYVDHGRVHEGELSAVTDELYRDWSADIADGKDSIMLAGTRAVVHELNGRARSDRLATLDSQLDPGRETALSDGHFASAGDVVITRRNDSRYRISQTDHVRNGYRWTVARVRGDGGLEVVHTQSGRRTMLPADYVRTHVELGYASTIRTCQGLTTDVSRTLFTGIESRDAVYVPLSRGREQNHAYVVSGLSGDEHSVLTEKALRPDSAVDIFTTMLAREGAAKSATTVDREALDPIRRLAPAADAYTDAVRTAAETVAGPDVMAAIDAAATAVSDGTNTFDLTTGAAWPVLRKHLATIAVTGLDPVAALTRAATSRELDSCADAAAVLDWRLDPRGDHHQGVGPLPWLRALPPQLAEHPVFGTYLVARRDLIAELADHVRDLATDWTTSDAPQWARPVVADPQHAELLGEVAVWRAAMAVDDVDRRPTGRDRFAIAERQYQTGLDKRFVRVVGDLNGPATRWAATARRIDPRLLADPYWPVVAQRLTLVDRAGTDVGQLLRTAVDPKHPLPDSMPAAALWWRLARTVNLPAASLDPAIAAAGPLRPAWVGDLKAALGDVAAAAVLADPSWPALVAAVESSDPDQWTARALLETADDLLREGQPGAAPRPDDYAAALARRIDDLVHHTPDPDDLPPEPDPADPFEGAVSAHDYSTDTTVSARDAAALTATAEDVEYALSLLALEPAVPDHELAAITDPAVDEPPVEPADRDTDGSPGRWRRPTPEHESAIAAEARYERLRKEFHAADARVAQLRAALTIGDGMHSKFAAPMVVELRARYDAQRPYALAAANAHAEWIEADTEAGIAETTRDEAHRTLLAAQTAAAVADSIVAAYADRLAESTAQDALAYLDALDLISQRRVAELDAAESDRAATYLRTLAQERRTESTRAQQDFEDAAGGADRIVTDHDVHAIAHIGTDLDFTALREELAARSAIRDEWAAVRLQAVAEFAEATAHTTPTPPQPDTRTTTENVQQQQLSTPVPPQPTPVDVVALAENMREDPLKMMRRAALDSHINRIRAALDRPDPAMTAWVGQRTLDDSVQHVHRIEADHARLAEQAAAVAHAQQAAAAAIEAGRQSHAAATHLAELRQTLANAGTFRTGLRRQLTSDIGTAEAELARLAVLRDTATHAAAVAAAEAEHTGAMKPQWDSTIRRAADTATLHAELSAARAAADEARHAAADADHRRNRNTEKLQAQLADATAELARRRELTAPEQAAEKRVRAENEHAHRSQDVSERPPASFSVEKHAPPHLDAERDNPGTGL